ADMTRFLRDMVAIPSESCDEKRVVHRIKEEMEKVGFDKVEIDPMGNVLGYIGHGPRLVAMDAHIDTVGIGNIKNWDFDPYEGMETDELIGGRGTSDQEGGMASMVYAGKIIKDLGLEDEYTLLVTGTDHKFRANAGLFNNVLPAQTVAVFFLHSTGNQQGIFIFQTEVFND
ncbi:M20/M25/M40 family metallo-hydrolase, partial [Escherichia sp. SP-MK2]